MLTVATINAIKETLTYDDKIGKTDIYIWFCKYILEMC